MNVRGWLWIALTAVLCGGIPHAVAAQRIGVEAEGYADSHDLGGWPIQPWPYSDCSSGYVLRGLDTPGEWTEYDVGFPSAASYSVSIKCQGSQGRQYALKVELIPVGGGESRITEFSFTGLGYG